MKDPILAVLEPMVSPQEKVRRQLEYVKKSTELRNTKQDLSIMKALIEGESPIDVASRYNISPVKVQRLMKNALQASKDALKLSQEDLLHFELMKMQKAEQIVHNALVEVDVINDNDEYAEGGITPKDKIAAALALMKISQYRTKDLLGLAPLSSQKIESDVEHVDKSTSSIISHISDKLGVTTNDD